MDPNNQTQNQSPTPLNQQPQPQVMPHAQTPPPNQAPTPMQQPAPQQVNTPGGVQVGGQPPAGQYNPAQGYPPQNFGPQPTAYPQTAPQTVDQMQQQVNAQVGGQPQATKAPSVANTTQNALNIAEIRDGVVIMNDGGFRSVVLVQSINFDLMSTEEKEAVEFAYQGFLNSLYFDIQIFIRSAKVDIRPYLNKLDKIRLNHENMLLALLMEDYIQFIELLSQETNIMAKDFYVVVPYYPPVTTQLAIKEGKKLFGNLFSAFKQNKAREIITINEQDMEKAKSELRNRVQAIISGLLQVGVQAVALDTEELIELYYDAYNPDTATRQPLKNFSEMTAPIIEKGRGQAAQPDLDPESY